MPLFSIVIPVKNGKHFLEKCIASVMRQTFRDFEILVLTDATTNDDGTLDWLYSIESEHLQVIHSDLPLNIQENWDRIRQIEKSEFFTILGYDDLLYPDYLQTIKELIEKYPEASLYQTHFDFINDQGKRMGEAPPMRNTANGQEFLRTILSASYFIMATGYMVRTADYEKVEGMPVRYPNLLYADYELWLRLTFLSTQVVASSRSFAFRIHQSTTKRSSVDIMLKAFTLFVDFLHSLQTDDQCKEIIREKGTFFLQYHCNEMAYRLIRTPVHLRKDLTVKDLFSAFGSFGWLLQLGDLRLGSNKNLKLAKLVDSNLISRRLYLVFKQVFSKPVVKSSFE